MSSSPNLITLYDIPTTKAETWSPNVWKVRMTLNYKRIPYQTEWVELSDISEVAKEIGAKPTTPLPDGTMLWTCPMLMDPNHLNSEGKPTVLSDSNIIVAYLDKMYPERKVIPEGTAALHNAWTRFIEQNVTMRLFPIVAPFYSPLLSERSNEYYIRTREKWFGPLSQICPDVEKGWAELRAGLDKVAAVLDANGNGEGGDLRVIPGHDSYADFALVGFFLWASVVLGKEDMDRLKSWNGGRWGRLLELHAPLLRVD
ncbi:hypothetical protein BD779DRAFT_1646039 [Infundibulicybe gibba]|nr:hypothetical protein BD779DRAFT_1646039 [Infundibulicybe gibba]